MRRVMISYVPERRVFFSGFYGQFQYIFDRAGSGAGVALG